MNKYLRIGDSKRFSLISALVSALALIASVTSGSSAAADYPSRPIHVLTPSSPGGPHDLVARVLGPKLSEALGQPIVVENRPGAGMILATGALARSAPDGLTLGTIATQYVTNPFLVDKLPYDTAKDFSPVAIAVILSSVLVVSANSPYKTLNDLIATAKQRPEGLKFSSPAVGGTPHFAGEMLAKAAGIPVLHVPYKGIPEARLAVLRGDVDFLFDSLEAIELIRTGKLRAIAVGSLERVPALKDTPTLAETYPGFTVDAFIGFAAPAGTPPEIIQKLNKVINEAVLSPEVNSKLKEMMFLPVTMSVEQFKTFLDQQTLKWGTLIKSQNLHAQ